jgi:hypothetical protein
MNNYLRLALEANVHQMVVNQFISLLENFDEIKNSVKIELIRKYESNLKAFTFLR